MDFNETYKKYLEVFTLENDSDNDSSDDATIDESDSIENTYRNNINRIQADCIRRKERERSFYKQKKERTNKQKEMKRMSNIQKTIDKLKH